MALTGVPGDAEVFYGRMNGGYTMPAGQNETDWIPFSVSAIKMADRAPCPGYEGPRTGAVCSNMDADNAFSELIAVAGPTKQPLPNMETGPFHSGGFSGFAKWKVTEGGMKYFRDANPPVPLTLAVALFDTRNGIGGAASANLATINWAK
jgi:hypothetical protein